MTAEQQARDILERMGVEDAQSWSAGELVELANLIAERGRERWRSVKDRLPKTNLPVLVHGQWHNDAPLYAICAIHDGRWHSLVGGGSLWGTVTHWMPLPEAPK